MDRLQILSNRPAFGWPVGQNQRYLQAGFKKLAGILRISNFFSVKYLCIFCKCYIIKREKENDSADEGVLIMHAKTMTFSVHEDKEREMRQILTEVYDALKQKGYNPINQIVGYILSEDPTYITTYNTARSLIRRIDRDELLQVMVKYYLTA